MSALGGFTSIQRWAGPPGLSRTSSNPRPRRSQPLGGGRLPWPVPPRVRRAFAGREPFLSSAHQATAWSVAQALVSAARRLPLPGRACACACADDPLAGVRPCDGCPPVESRFSSPSPTPSCPSGWVARKERGRSKRASQRRTLLLGRSGPNRDDTTPWVTLGRRTGLTSEPHWHAALHRPYSSPLPLEKGASGKRFARVFTRASWRWLTRANWDPLRGSARSV